MVDLLDGAFYADDPHATWARLRAEDPVHLDEEHDVWGITRYDDVRAVSKDPATWSSAGGMGASREAADDSAW